MAKKRVNGEGTIGKRKDGRWEARYIAGRDPETGKQIRKSILGKTQAEVRTKLKEALAGATEIDVVKSGEYNVAGWVQAWYSLYAQPNVRETTARYYKGYIDHHVLPRLGDIPLNKLTSLDIQQFYKDLLENGRIREDTKAQKPGLSSTTILMFELVTGTLPFKGDNAVEIAIKQMKEPIPSVREINPNIPQSVENIILKASAKNPKNRYESARAMYDDLTTCLDASRANEARYSYPYPEFEEEKKPVKVSREQLQEEKKKELKEEKVEKKTNVALIVTLSIAAIIILALSIYFFLVPKFRKEPDITIPDVTNMTVVNAESTLKNAGFSVATDITYEYNNSIPENMVIGTTPEIGRSVKKDNVITLIVSKGIDGITLENYVDKKIDNIKSTLENAGINVIVDYEEYAEKDNKEEGLILSQDTEAGTIMKKGETIVFKVVKLMTTYPNFVSEDYSVDGVQKFCDEKGITLEITYQETSSKPAGSILSQSRAAGTKVVSGVNLRIVVAKEPVKTTPTDTDTKTDDKTDTKSDSKTDTKTDTKTETKTGTE